MTEFLTAAFYQFVELPDHAALKPPLLAACEAAGVLGNILLAPEGINGTIAGPAAGVRAVLAWLRADARLATLQHKESRASHAPFYRMKVRLKREIVTLGVPEANPSRLAGHYVKPQDWNRLLDDPSVVVIDTRNDYEVGIGSFQGAINPHTRSFSDLPDWVQAASAPGQPLAGKPKVAMFCTGGIRCEKSTALLRARGFDDVYHLEGGILKYLETVPESESRWQGQCFVFDERVSVGHGLSPGDLELCRSCRHPLGDAERASPFFVRGASCERCHDQRTEAEKRNLLERERQVGLARERQQPHLGARLAPPSIIATTAPTLVGPPAAAGEARLPVLYSFRRCPYAMRARMALQISGQVCELREVVLRSKPPELRAASPKATVPVLVDVDGRVLDQSLEIMQWALSRSDPQQWLQPPTGSLSDMLALIAEMDDQFKFHLDRYKYPQRYQADVAAVTSAKLAHREGGSALLRRLASRLQTSPYLFGDRSALADMAIAPFVRQFAHVDIEWFEAQDWPGLKAWLARWEGSALLESVMGKYPAWASGLPGVRFPA